MKTKEYNKFIQGYIYALNECAQGKDSQLKIKCFQSECLDNFDNGLIKGLFEFELKQPPIR